MKKIFWITGGIGNQLFIYAASKNIHNEKSVYFDLTNFKWDIREFKLDKLGFKIKKANWFNLLLFRYKIRKLISLFLKNSKLYPKHLIENINQNQLDLFNIDFFSYIQGYWQSTIYYEDVLQHVKLNYKLEDCLKNDKYLSLQFLINTYNSVAIHVRRSDYFLKHNSVVFNILDKDYYNQCISEISAIIDKPLYFVFTDDISWSKNLFKNLGQDVVYVSEILNVDYLEFDLMYKCKHIITANSTFSWWAAELNDNFGKIIFAPKNYFSDKNLQFKYSNKELLYNPIFNYR